MAFEPRQTPVVQRVGRGIANLFRTIESWLEAEREQVGLWAPVGLGAGVAAWFVLPDRMAWLTFCCLALALACGASMLPAGARLRQIGIAAGLLLCVGCLLVWGKAQMVGQPPLVRAQFTELTANVVSVEALPAKAIARIMIHPVDRPDLPRQIRVNMADRDIPAGLGQGAVIRFRVRLMPPAPAAVPGAYDFARRAYFQGIGATGRALAPVVMVKAGRDGGAPTLRTRLFDHVRSQMSGPAGSIAATLATGDQGAISEADAEAMRRSGLAHLLSISGLHVTALIGAVIFVLLRLLALSRKAALHWPLMLIAAAGGALAGVGYTFLTGTQVPTVRSCVAALLVLGGLALGREAITLRLVAAGALFVLVLWPDALVGPSFQMSFAAVITLVALGEHSGFRALTMARDEVWYRKLPRIIAGLLLTGLAIELVLAPIALFHFHRTGMLGAVANLVAIPLTTFVVMPFEALALVLDIGGIGAPAWWVTEQALRLLLLVAHGVAASPASVAFLPPFSAGIFVLVTLGGLWCLLWRTRWRWLGLIPVGVATASMLTTPVPDILVTGDGRHVAVRTPEGGLALLRERAGGYVRDMLSESAGYDGELQALADLPDARCSEDLCAVAMKGATRPVRLLVTRSSLMVPPDILRRDCAAADIVISDRWLPRICPPRWVRIDRRFLARSGGVAITLANAKIHTVKAAGDGHPWIAQPVNYRRGRAGQLYRRSRPASLP